MIRAPTAIACRRQFYLSVNQTWSHKFLHTKMQSILKRDCYDSDTYTYSFPHIVSSDSLVHPYNNCASITVFFVSSTAMSNSSIGSLLVSTSVKASGKQASHKFMSK